MATELPQAQPNDRTRQPSAARRAIRWILVGATIVLEIVAAQYHLPWLTFLGAAPFWIAVLDATRDQPKKSRLIATVAIAFLAGIAVFLILALVLVVSRPPVKPVSSPSTTTVPLPAPPASPAH